MTRVDSLRGHLAELISSCNKCSLTGKPFIEYEACKWLSEDVKTLVVLESPPRGHKEKFLYNLGSFDQLRLSLSFILQADPDIQVLRKLNKNSIFVTDAVKCRPPSAGDVKGMAESCQHLLKREIDLLRPEKVLPMGWTASLSISSILGIEVPGSLRGLTEIASGEASIIFAPHPNYIFRFRRDLSAELRELLLT